MKPILGLIFVLGVVLLACEPTQDAITGPEPDAQFVVLGQGQVVMKTAVGKVSLVQDGVRGISSMAPDRIQLDFFQQWPEPYSNVRTSTKAFAVVKDDVGKGYLKFDTRDLETGELDPEFSYVGDIACVRTVLYEGQSVSVLVSEPGENYKGSWWASGLPLSNINVMVWPETEQASLGFMYGELIPYEGICDPVLWEHWVPIMALNKDGFTGTFKIF